MQVQSPAVDGERIIRRATLKLMPLLGLLYLIAYLDRQNIGFAKLQMVADLGVSEAAYGLGASLFFIGYLLFEIPSNIMLDRVGAPMVRTDHAVMGRGDGCARLHPQHGHALHPALSARRL